MMRYALQFWPDHVLSYAADGGDLCTDAALIKSLLALYTLHEKIQTATYHTQDHDDTVDTKHTDTSSELDDERLRKIAHLPIFAIIRDTLRLRLTSQNHDSSDGKGTFHDSSAVSLIRN